MNTEINPKVAWPIGIVLFVILAVWGMNYINSTTSFDSKVNQPRKSPPPPPPSMAPPAATGNPQ